MGHVLLPARWRPRKPQCKLAPHLTSPSTGRQTAAQFGSLRCAPAPVTSNVRRSMRLYYLAFALLAIVSVSGFSEVFARGLSRNEIAIQAARESSCFLAKEKECAKRLEDECLAAGGTWGGVISGRGRSPGCTYVTIDGGNHCTTSNDCAAACIATSELKNPSSCQCSPRSREPKGESIHLCTATGVSSVHAD